MAQRRRKRDHAFAEGVGANLARLRRTAGISQEELGFRAAVHRTQVSNFERGETVPDSDTLFRLSMALGASPSELFEGLGWEAPGYNAGRVVVLNGRIADDRAPGGGER